MMIRQRYERGFSMIEVLVALAVLGVALGSIGLLQVSSLQVSRDSSLGRVSSLVADAEAGFVRYQELISTGGAAVICNTQNNSGADCTRVVRRCHLDADRMVCDDSIRESEPDMFEVEILVTDVDDRVFVHRELVANLNRANLRGGLGDSIVGEEPGEEDSGSSGGEGGDDDEEGDTGKDDDCRGNSCVKNPNKKDKK